MSKNKKRLADIPKLTRAPTYRIDVPWSCLENTLERYERDYGLDLSPKFQRPHVWTMEQGIRYVEYVLRGGCSAKELLFNSVDWNKTRPKTIILVDGKQRLNAVLRFIRDDLPVFGKSLSKWTDAEIFMRSLSLSFKFCMNDLPDEKSILQWYLDINSGGVVHSQEELDKVRTMLYDARHGDAG